MIRLVIFCFVTVQRRGLLMFFFQALAAQAVLELELCLHANLFSWLLKFFGQCVSTRLRSAWDSWCPWSNRPSPGNSLKWRLQLCINQSAQVSVWVCSSRVCAYVHWVPECVEMCDGVSVFSVKAGQLPLFFFLSQLMPSSSNCDKSSETCLLLRLSQRMNHINFR